MADPIYLMHVFTRPKPDSVFCDREYWSAWFVEQLTKHLDTPETKEFISPFGIKFTGEDTADTRASVVAALQEGFKKACLFVGGADVVIEDVDQGRAIRVRIFWDQLRQCGE